MEGKVGYGMGREGIIKYVDRMGGSNLWTEWVGKGKQMEGDFVYLIRHFFLAAPCFARYCRGGGWGCGVFIARKGMGCLSQGREFGNMRGTGRGRGREREYNI